MNVAARFMHPRGFWTIEFNGEQGSLLVDPITGRRVGDRECIRLNQRR